MQLELTLSKTLDSKGPLHQAIAVLVTAPIRRRELS
jgi:hypothetical protein